MRQHGITHGEHIKEHERSFGELYQVTKIYPYSLGLSACFRQWKATSHCRFLHGYALQFEFTFQCRILDDRNWVIDFGGLKSLKQDLVTTFDHKLIMASDDPHKDIYEELEEKGIAEMVEMPNVGCEAFARYGSAAAELLVYSPDSVKRELQIMQVTCREHGANSATYIPGVPPGMYE